MHEIPPLDAPGLRRFALTTGAIVVLLFGGLLPWLLGAAWPLWPWIAGGALAAWGLVAPATLGPVYQGWMRFGLLLGRVTTPIVMGAVFFLVVTPVGLVMRALRRDPLARRFDAAATSYRVPSEEPRKDGLEHPF
jgi:hypothetical protein